MAACDHCGKVSREVVEQPNGRSVLRLCPLCRAQLELSQASALRPPRPDSEGAWWKRLWNRLRGR